MRYAVKTGRVSRYADKSVMGQLPRMVADMASAAVELFGTTVLISI